MSTTVLSFVIVLGVLIFFHELGHFLVARLFGVGVERFSLGFGPRIFGKTVGITDYRVSAIPLGGYVKMVGEEPDAEIDPADIPISFTHKHVLKRILIVAAGPTFNLLLAVLIFFAIFAISGTYVLKATVGTVNPDTPAERAGLETGDMVTAINGKPVETWDDMSELIGDSEGAPVQMTIRRGETTHRFQITPEMRTTENFFGEEVRRYLIGITSAGDVESVEMSILDAAVSSVVRTYEICELTVVSIGKMIAGSLSTKTLGGPIMIAQLAGEQARQGTTNLVFFIALLSVNLAILNFLPIPVLDGGHLVFFFAELIMGRPVNTRMREMAQQAGIFVLLMLMIFVFYNDIVRILTS